jgi:oxygen-dependent protoporphyrinogen oxidase
MEGLTDALLARLPRGSIQTNVSIEALTRSGDGFAVHFAHGGQLLAPLVLVATPPAITARLVAAVDAQLAELCGRIRSVSVATVALGYARHAVSHPLNGTGFIVPRREGLRIRALSWVSSKWARRAPAGHVLLRAYVGGAGDPHAVEEPDPELIDTVEREITPLLGVLDAPDMIRVYRWRNATPQLEVGHGELMRTIDQRLEMISRLAVTACGFRGTGIADCVEDARRQARQLAERTALALTA